MKPIILTVCFCLTLTLCGCGDAQPVNVAEDADAAAIEEYNRLNNQAMDDMEEAEAEANSDTDTDTSSDTEAVESP